MSKLLPHPANDHELMKPQGEGDWLSHHKTGHEGEARPFFLFPQAFS